MRADFVRSTSRLSLVVHAAIIALLRLVEIRYPRVAAVVYAALAAELLLLGVNTIVEGYTQSPSNPNGWILTGGVILAVVAYAVLRARRAWSSGGMDQLV
jgi:uncharacterized membrane protein HdeD (DUF308 family)